MGGLLPSQSAFHLAVGVWGGGVRGMVSGVELSCGKGKRKESVLSVGAKGDKRRAPCGRVTEKELRKRNV